jgi:uncharacterized delta-60 repeat protein
MVVARLNANGSLDTGFSSDGKTTLTVSDVVDGPDHNGFRPAKVIVLDDDKFLLFAAAHQTPVLIRYAANGTLDSTFGGGDGFTTISFGDAPSGNTASDMLLTSDGKIMVGGGIGTFDDGDNNFPAIARLDADGNLDDAFGQHGIALAGADDDGAVTRLAVDSHGRIVSLSSGLIRWTADGLPDTTLGPNGFIDRPLNNGGQQSFALTADDRILYNDHDTLVRVTEQPRPALQLGINGALIITETDGDNTIAVNDAGNDDLVVIVNGVTTHFSVAAVKSLNILTGDGDDDVSVQADMSASSTVILGDGANSLALANGEAHVTTGADDDEITVGDGNHTIDSGSGNDSIATGNGQITVDGGDGDDSITTGAGDDSVIGGQGSDTLNGGAGDDWLVGGADRFFFDAPGSDNVLHGGDGDDVLLGADGRDTLYGGANNDLLVGFGGSDKLVGGGGKDKIGGYGGRDRIYGGAGNDQLDGGAGDDHVFGGASDDRLFGGRGADTLNGEDGNDIFTSGGDETIDHLDGGAGTNRALFVDDIDELLNITATP